MDEVSAAPLLPPLAGWTLEAARALLAEQFPDREVRLVETAPPERKRRENAPGRDNASGRDGAPGHAMHWGQWRVLRVTPGTDGCIELTVAREQLAAPDLVAPDEAASIPRSR